MPSVHFFPGGVLPRSSCPQIWREVDVVCCFGDHGNPTRHALPVGRLPIEVTGGSHDMTSSKMGNLQWMHGSGAVSSLSIEASPGGFLCPGRPDSSITEEHNSRGSPPSGLCEESHLVIKQSICEAQTASGRRDQSDLSDEANFIVGGFGLHLVCFLFWSAERMCLRAVMKPFRPRKKRRSSNSRGIHPAMETRFFLEMEILK